MNLVEMNSKTFGSKWAPAQFEMDFGEGLQSLGDQGSFDYWLHSPSCRIELKSARVSKHGIVKFQYIHPDWFEVCVCLVLWTSNRVSYWVFTSSEMKPHLSIQHRDQDSFQLRISTKKREALRIFETGQDVLRSRVLKAAKEAANKREVVKLHSNFGTFEGWPEIEKRLSKRIIRDFGPDWVIRILPVPKRLDTGDHDLLPYPHFIGNERRMDYFARPEPIVGEGNIRATVWSITDFLDQFLSKHQFDERV